MRAILVLIAVAAFSLGAESRPRSKAVRDFIKDNPCPATGAPRGACPGWQVDHITPLKCGGPDTPANMQWLTVEQHKIKTASESKLCRRR